MTWFDLLLIAILVLSIGFAAIRGAVREVATLAALGLAALLAYLLFNPMLGLLGLKGSIFGMLGVAAVLLGVLFILIYIGAHIGLKQVSFDRNMMLADRVGGGFFGLLRGLALIGLGFLGYAYYQDEPNRPEAVSQAALLPLAKSTAGFFESIAPQHDSKEIISADEIPSNGNASPKINAASDGYERGERAALEEIVTTATTADDPATDQRIAPTEDAIADILLEDDEENDSEQ